MHECEGLWAIWYIYGWRAKAVVWRLTEGDRSILSLSLSRALFLLPSSLREPRRVKSSRILTKKAPTMCNIPRWILTRCQARHRGAARRPRARGSYARFLRPFVNQDSNRINIKTVNLDAHNGAWGHPVPCQQRHVASWLLSLTISQ